MYRLTNPENLCLTLSWPVAQSERRGGEKEARPGPSLLQTTLTNRPPACQHIHVFRLCRSSRLAGRTSRFHSEAYMKVASKRALDDMDSAAELRALGATWDTSAQMLGRHKRVL